MNEQEQLRNEARYVSNRIRQLTMNPMEGKFDLEHLCKINQHLFQDLPKLGIEYDKFYKPGQYRAEILPWKTWMKNRPIPGTKDISCIVYSNMDKAIIKDTEQFLKKSINITKMKQMRVNTFIENMTEIYSRLDYLHPFRDGNSRTIREFTRELALKAGYDMCWEKSNQNQQTRNELYIARDFAVNKIAYDKTHIRELKYDIEIYMKPFKNHKTLAEILSSNIEKIPLKKRKITLVLNNKTGKNQNLSRWV